MESRAGKQVNMETGRQVDTFRAGELSRATGASGAEAACSVHGSPSGWRAESVSTDLHVLRQEFIPPNPVAPRTLIESENIYESR